jgi:D-alanyl-D-alanine carboxypeptidase
VHTTQTTARDSARGARHSHRARRRAATTLALAAALAVPPAATAAAAAPSDSREAAGQRLDADLEAVTDAGAIGVVGHSRGATGRPWSGAAGVRTIDGAQPARPGDRTRVASVTKAMVSTLAMQEVDRGRWSLDTAVGDVLPGLLPGHDDVTLEQLLSHRSGLPDYIFAITGDGTDLDEFIAALHPDRTDRELVRAALTQDWLFAPGTDFAYSNTNYVVVGMMLEKVNRTRMASLLERRVFRPAGMKDSSFPTTGRTFTGRDHLTDYAIFERPYNLDRASSSIFSSAGAVVSTAPDIASFYRALLGGRLVSKAAVARMLEPRTESPLHYGLGIYTGVDPCPGANGEPQPLYGHDGGAFGTVTLVFSSADGRRQASLSWSGRQFVAEPPTNAPANRFLVDALTSTCPRPVPETTKRSATESLERLSRDVDTRAAAALSAR